MIFEGDFDFGLPTIASAGAETVSPAVFDAGSAKVYFQQGSGPLPRVYFKARITADSDPTIQVNLVAADNALLTTNPVILGSSGVVATNEDGTALVTTDVVSRSFPVNFQGVAKQHYGLLVTLGGTNPDTLEAECEAAVVWDAQSNMTYTPAVA